MNIVILILAFSIQSSLASDIDCNVGYNLVGLAKGITYPNCNNPENINNFQAFNTESLCIKCKSEFEMIYGKKITENAKHLQEAFFKTAINEYKKNITNNILNALKTRAMYSSGAKYNKSIASCKMKTLSDFTNNCSSEAAKKLLAGTDFFNNLQRDLSNDVAKYLSADPGFNPINTLLGRRKKSCHIIEKDLQLFSSATYEEALSGEMIEYIKKIDPAKFNSVSEIFESDEFIENFGDLSELKVSLGTHPFISLHLRSPHDFVNFMKKIPAPSATNDLRSFLYSKENGEAFDADLAESCTKSFEALKESICSSEFENSKLFNDPMNNFGKLEISTQLPSEDQFAASERLIDNNIKLLELCENKSGSGKKDLTAINKKIGLSLNDEQKSQSFELFRTTKYNSEMGSLVASICSMDDSKCVQGTLTCSIYTKYKAFNKTNTELLKPADFANNESNELLRSMLGDSLRIEPDARKILIAEGILPRENGKFNEKPEIPETQEQFFAKVSSQKIIPVAGQMQSSKNFPAKKAEGHQKNNPSIPAISGTHSYSASPAKMDDISDIVRASTEEIKDIQDEIKRRLGDLPQTSPKTIEEAKRIARDSFKNNGGKMAPYQEQALAQSVLRQQTLIPTPPVVNFDEKKHSPSLSKTETLAEKWKNAQKDAALMGMQGAQQILSNGASAGRDPASVEATSTNLTKIALNIAEDPKIKLSDIFTSKFEQNDLETQLLKVLLKSQNNFLLQVKDINFKIVFDERNNFNILIESGELTEAERMRPLLEIFLTRLKTKFSI